MTRDRWPKAEAIPSVSFVEIVDGSFPVLVSGKRLLDHLRVTHPHPFAVAIVLDATDQPS